MSAKLSVWIVWADHEYEGSEIVSVHRTSAGAEAQVRRLTERTERARAARQPYFDDESNATPDPGWPEDLPTCDGFRAAGEYPVRS